MYGTRQAARQMYVQISTWIEEHGYIAVKCEKIIIMKHEGEEWITRGLFVDDMISAGPLHWVALHHVMGYLEENPSFKLSYRRGGFYELD